MDEIKKCKLPIINVEFKITYDAYDDNSIELSQAMTFEESNFVKDIAMINIITYGTRVTSDVTTIELNDFKEITNAIKHFEKCYKKVLKVITRNHEKL